MIGGQVNDIEGEGKHPTAELLESIHRAKTGALLRASVRMGAIYAGRGRQPARRAHLLRRAHRPGVSDRGRHARRRAVVGSSRQDRRQGRRSRRRSRFPAVYGIERSREMAEQERLAAHLALQTCSTIARERLARTGRSGRAAQRMKRATPLKYVALDQLLVGARAGRIARKSASADPRRRSAGRRAEERQARPRVASDAPGRSCSSACPTSAAAASSSRPRSITSRIDVDGLDLPRRRSVHRRLHRLPAAARRGARVGDRRRPRPARLETAQRSARGGPRRRQRALSDSREDFPETFDLAVCDVSFISVTLLIPAIVPSAQRNTAQMVILVKPQFEVGRGEVGKGGIVRDPALASGRVRSRAQARVEALGFRTLHSSRVRFAAPKATGSSCFMPGANRLRPSASSPSRAATARPPLVPELIAWLAARGVAVSLDEETAAYAGRSAPRTFSRDQTSPQGAQLVIVLGGDGTLLSAARAARTGAIFRCSP